MLLTVQNPFNPVNLRSKDSHRMLTPFSGVISPYQSYAKGIDINVRKLKERFPNREAIQLKSMLEEL